MKQLFSALKKCDYSLLLHESLSKVAMKFVMVFARIYLSGRSFSTSVYLKYNLMLSMFKNFFIKNYFFFLKKFFYQFYYSFTKTTEQFAIKLGIQLSLRS